ncbi:DNA polymerase III subunit gamma/tau [Patescibacteria group bacterium]|nr:DNA polymerase III subunit gamma/tau [Patescibacteria group bacterium]
MTYYLKYRPQKLDDLDLKEVRETLTKTVKSGKVHHAFLFSGPKGSGKTSAARILAKIVNCEKRRKNSPEPCNKCLSCLAIAGGSNIDVIELDAASHRGIDDVRTLRDAVKLAPAKAEKKVYIIDEAHMLTKEASNALLKTLEEPPEHVMFILATTNPEKLIETIRSRTFNLVFNKATVEELTRSLSRVVKGEKIRVDKETLELIAKASGGSFRDATKILEQLVAQKIKLKKSVVEEFLFQKKSMNVDKVISLLAQKDTKSLILEVEKVVSRGGSMRLFCEAIVSRLREALLAKIGLEGSDIESLNKKDLVLLIKLFSRALDELPSSVLDQIPVELAIIGWCQPETDHPLDDESVKDGNPSAAKTQNPGKSGARNRKNKSARSVVAKSVQSAGKSVKSISEEVWLQILSAVKPKSTATEALLRAAKPLQYDGSTLTLGVFYKFHKEKLETGIHREILEDMAGEILGGSVRIECTLTQRPQTEKNDSTTVEKSEEVVLTEGEDDDIIKVAKEIFGG